MKRRELIVLVAGALAQPGAAPAQQPMKIYRIRPCSPRSWIALIILVGPLGIIGAVPTRAQSGDRLAALRAQVSRLYTQGKYAEAISVAQHYVALARQKHGQNHTEFATAISWLAYVYNGQGRYAEAESLYKRSLAITEKSLGPDHPDVGTSLTTLAEFYREQRRYSEAEPLYRRLLTIRERALGSQTTLIELARRVVADRLYADSLHMVAEFYEALGRYSEAEPLLNSELAIREKYANLAELTAAGNMLAMNYKYQGRYAQAEPMLKRDLAAAERELGPNHLDLANPLNDLASLYWNQGRYDEAEPLFRRALGITEKALGPDHPKVGTSLNNLAELYRTQGRHGDADRLLKRSLAIAEKTSGNDGSDIAAPLNSLAWMDFFLALAAAT
jgi:tetratricopeptide (TPR) repeat protein